MQVSALEKVGNIVRNVMTKRYHAGLGPVKDFCFCYQWKWGSYSVLRKAFSGTHMRK